MRTDVGTQSEYERRPHILVLAWMIGPDSGSELAAAWGMALVAAEIGDVTILCHPRYHENTQRWCDARPGLGIEVVSVKPKHSWATPILDALPKGYFVGYLAWLAAVPEVSAVINRRRPVDLAVHAALGCYWMPSPVHRLGTASVWGSVGGATVPAPGLASVLGFQGMIERAVERVVIGIGARLPATRHTMRRSSLTLIENELARSALPADVAVRARVFNRALLTDVHEMPALPRGRHILFPSTLNGRKGAILALDGFAKVPEPYKLVFANSGPDEARLRRRVDQLGIADRVEFLGRVGRDEYFTLLKTAAIAVFAGINEDGGCALCEAMQLGTPTVVLSYGGPREIVEHWGTDRERVILVPPMDGPAATAEALGLAMAQMLERAPERTDNYLDRTRAIAELRRLYSYAMEAAVPDRQTATRRERIAIATAGSSAS